MSTKQETIDYLLDQAGGAGELRAQKMFGEYALYCDGKVVALVCDDQLFVKITEEGKQYVGDLYEEGYPYPGAKAWTHISEDAWENREWLSELLRITASVLPMPKPKKKKK